MLTLELPFLADDEESTQQRIVRGEFVPLRHRNRGIPWDAETACLVAMERDRARRYPNVAAGPARS